MSGSLPAPSLLLPAARGRGARLIWVLAVLAVVVAGAYLAWRGVWRGAGQSGDLAVGYSAARAWLLGHDPYDATILNGDFLRAGGGELASGGLLDDLRNVYFPGTLPVFIPLALLSWPDARLVGLAINLAASLFIAIGVNRLLGWRLTSTKALVLSAFLLALAPIHTTIAYGQTGIVATAAIVAAMLYERSGRPYASGIMYGLATAIKVQVGLPFLVYLMWRRRWAPALTSFLVLAGLTIVSVVRMELTNTTWLNDWLVNLSLLSRPGGINDPSVLNADRFSLINLQYPLQSLISDGATAQLVTLGVVGSAALALLWLRRGRDARPDLLSLAVVTVLGLLVAYHRYYDAVLLAIPIAWAASSIGTPQRRWAIVVLVLSADFILPLQSIFYEIGQSGILPTSLTDGLFWNAVVLAQHVWALALMVVVLLVAAYRDRDPLRQTGQLETVPPDPVAQSIETIPASRFHRTPVGRAGLRPH